MQRFNIRVYGILINSNKEVLLSDESRYGTSFTKFPGGGLNWGEGTKKCLQREFLEELNVEIEVGEPFYLTDFFQESAFNQNDQLLSFYYFVTLKSPNTIDELQLEGHHDDGESFRWKALDQLSEDNVTFPIDKLVAEKLSQL